MREGEGDEWMGWMDGWMSCDAMLGEGEGEAGMSQTAGFPVPPRRGAAADGPKRVSELLPTRFPVPREGTCPKVESEQKGKESNP